MIKTKVVERPELNFWQKIYVPEIARGLWITSLHFFRNLTLHLLHAVGLFRHIRAGVTYQYPEEQTPLALRTRTRHRLTKREDGSPRCVACMMCSTICPAKCIHIVAGEREDNTTIEKYPVSFSIDELICVVCGLCVEACPCDAIRMDTGTHMPPVERRDQAYLGVLVDDLITKGVTEPYRMFTSRAEFRLMLREDNADLRLTEKGRELGLVDDARWDAFNRKRDAVSRETERLRSVWVNPRNLPLAEAERVLGKSIEREYTLLDLLRRPDVNYAALMSLDGGKYANPELAPPAEGVSRETEAADMAASVIEQIEIAVKYAGYIDLQKTEVERASHYENLKLPADLDYLQVSALSFEARQTLAKHRPETLGLASRISGITPATVSLLLVHLKKNLWKNTVPLKPAEQAEA